MWDRVGMAPSSSRASGHWWTRRTPSVAVFLGVLGVLCLVTLALVRQVADVLPEVGKDQMGEDNWDAPLGVNIGGGFQVARVPDCAAGAFTRIVLWDARSEPYWEVSGPATPLTGFVVGIAPEGFTVETTYRDPPAGAVLRLVAFRKDGGPVGIRYYRSNLRENRVVSGHPLQQFTISGFQTARVCGTGESSGPGGSTAGSGSEATATTTPDDSSGG